MNILLSGEKQSFESNEAGIRMKCPGLLSEMPGANKKMPGAKECQKASLCLNKTSSNFRKRLMF